MRETGRGRKIGVEILESDVGVDILVGMVVCWGLDGYCFGAGAGAGPRWVLYSSMGLMRLVWVCDCGVCFVHFSGLSSLLL